MAYMFCVGVDKKGQENLRNLIGSKEKFAYDPSNYGSGSRTSGICKIFVTALDFVKHANYFIDAFVEGEAIGTTEFYEVELTGDEAIDEMTGSVCSKAEVRISMLVGNRHIYI